MTSKPTNLTTFIISVCQTIMYFNVNLLIMSCKETYQSKAHLTEQTQELVAGAGDKQTIQDNCHLLSRFHQPDQGGAVPNQFKNRKTVLEFIGKLLIKPPPVRKCQKSLTAGPDVINGRLSV